ncbi:MAG: PilZ domain-containing protein [Candidatus Acidiferrales bacterium]
MNPERRTYGRRLLYSPEYLDMGTENGGVVVNLSEGGLGFQAVGRVEPDSQIPLSFSLGPGYRIDVKARVVWVSAQGKSGGAVFGKLSKDSRSLIREWLLKPEFEHEEETAVSAPGREGETEKHLPGSAPPSNITQTPTMPAQDSKSNLQSEASAGQSSPLQLSEIAAQNGVVLPPENAQTPTRSPLATSFPANVPAPPSVPLDDRAVPETPVRASEPEYAQLSQNPAAATTATEPARDVTPLAPLPKPPEVPAAPIRPQAVAPPTTRGLEHKRERPTGASFSAVPSLSAWSRKDAPAGSGTPASPTAATPLFPPKNVENIFARSTPLGMEPEPDRRSGSAALLIISIVIAVGAVFAFYVRTHRQQVGNAIIRVGNTVAGAPATVTTATPSTEPASVNPAGTPSTNGSTSAAQTTAPLAVQAPPVPATPGQLTEPGTSSPVPPTAPAKAPPAGAVPLNTQQSNVGHGSPETLRLGASANGQSAQNASKAAPSVAPPAPASPYSGQAEYQRAENYLNGKGVAQDPAEAAEWFWRSLEAGNTGAAIPLADLYLQGNGVSRSCTQARILLNAAARKNNSQAIQKLGQLPENCQ